MGTPEFALPTLAGIIAAGHEVAAVYSQPPRPAGRGMAERKSPVHLLADRHGLPVLTPKSLKGEPEQQAFAAHGADVGRRRGLRADPAQAGARSAAARLPQLARLGPAALARRRSHPARHHGRRPGDGGNRHAHGGGARHRAGLPRGARADRTGHDGRRAARPAGEARRRADGGGARRAASAARWPASRRPRRASPMPPRSTRARRGSTSR